MHDRVPAIGRIADPDPIDVMATAADGGDGLLTLAV